MIDVEVETEADGWARLGDVEALCRQAARAALDAHPGPRPAAMSVAVLLTDDAAVRRLNSAWRGKDQATNVLSFPSPASASGGSVRHLGDIALALETVEREAAADAKSPADHLAHLVVHGVLHLLGHDHEAEPDADAMEQIEVAALARLGIADPYRVTA